MKSLRLFFLILVLFCISLNFIQLSAKRISINITQQSIFVKVPDAQVTQLKVTGILDKKLISNFLDYYPNVEYLDMMNARIVSFVDEKKVYLANEIPSGVFNRRVKLKSVILPRGVQKIGKGAFWSCVNLEKVILPDSIKVIDQFAFQLCSKLRQITFPKGLVSIGGASFASCGSLIVVNCLSVFPPSMPEWNPFPSIDSNKCIMYVPAESIKNYRKSPFLREFTIMPLK